MLRPLLRCFFPRSCRHTGERLTSCPLDGQRQPSRHRRMGAGSLPRFRSSHLTASRVCRLGGLPYLYRAQGQHPDLFSSQLAAGGMTLLIANRAIVIPGTPHQLFQPLAMPSRWDLMSGHTGAWYEKNLSPAQGPSFVPPQRQALLHVRHFLRVTEKRVQHQLPERGALSGVEVKDTTKNGCTLQIQPRDKPTCFRRHFQTLERGFKAD